MDDGEFQWDDRKSVENYAKHGVSFTLARRVFEDTFAVETIDDREDYGETRHTIIGVVEARLLFVVFTMRNDAIRIISARGAEPHEHRRYHEENT